MASVPQRDGEIPGHPPRPTLGAILGVGLVLRVAAAFIVQAYADRIGKPCLFGDTFLYEDLARSIVAGRPFSVDQSGIPHFALRTPGYPLFLAACRLAFGPHLLPVRLVQAALGTFGVYGVYRLVSHVAPSRRHRTALIAAGLAAVEPYGVGLGALILSEGVFIPLMLAGLWGLATLWRGEGRAGDGAAGPPAFALTSVQRALLTGLVQGAAILVRPSWALIVPLLLGAFVVGSGRRSIRVAAILAIAAAAVLAPWWVRNARIFGRFVPTALWVGASLYDGVSPKADGSSDMAFLQAPDVVGLDETTQDDVLRRRAIDFARSNPGRVAWLAMVKAGRFWSPWPNAETLRSPVAAWVSAGVTLPLFGLVAVGAWDRRRDGRALVLLAGPLVYFLALHMVFVSSIRYRIPGFFPAMGLAAIGWGRLRRD